MTKSLISLLLACLFLSGAAWAQERFGQYSKQSVGVTSTYSPTSSHILIGISQQRRTSTAGIEYTRRIWENGQAGLEYKGELSPFFRESDPTTVGTETMVSGFTYMMPMAPKRVISVSHSSVGNFCSGPCSPIYPVYGKDETTYAAVVSPLGARLSLLPRDRVQPTFASDVGVVVSARDIPIDNATLLNYQFSFGPGVQVFVKRNTALRLEYLFRHISNAGSGSINPGIDQGVFRLSMSRYR